MVVEPVCVPPSHAMLEASLSYAMLSDPGRVRQGNEDACAADLAGCVFVVCDGVGGAAGGEVASHLAAKSFVARVISAREARTEPKSGLEAAVRDGVESANQAVHRQSQERTELHGMATTLVAMTFDLDRDLPGEAECVGTVWVANVGDSRCYRLRHGELEQLTQDHSIVEEQVRCGVITREQAEVSPIRNVITRAIGSEAEVNADVVELAACHGDLYLLASDGLTREMTVEDVAGVLRKSTQAGKLLDKEGLESTCAELVRGANERGGGDNITCLLVQVR